MSLEEVPHQTSVKTIPSVLEPWWQWLVCHTVGVSPVLHVVYNTSDPLSKQLYILDAVVSLSLFPSLAPEVHL